MHLIALSGCPTIALFGFGSFPDKASPRGEKIKVLANEKLLELTVSEVEEAMTNLLKAD